MSDILVNEILKGGEWRVVFDLMRAADKGSEWMVVPDAGGARKGCPYNVGVWREDTLHVRSMLNIGCARHEKGARNGCPYNLVEREIAPLLKGK